MKLVLTGGGTGGHVYPAISIGLHMKEQYNAELYYIGNDEKIEEQIAKQHQIPFYSVSSKGLEGNMPLHKYAGFAYNNSLGILQACSILKKIKPDYVLGTGGFVSAPVLAACTLLRIPYGIHEQNSVMGKVNRLFEKKATNVFHTFPIEESSKHKRVGIPVRFKNPLPTNGDYVVFTGGSGGSAKLNEFAVLFAKKYPEIPCIVVTGKRNYEDVLEQEPPTNLHIIDYATDMQWLYEQAAIMIARSGAGSVFEIANCGIPSIFVPLPTSAEDHQKKNALYFSEKNAAILVEQNDQFEARLEKEIIDLLDDEEKKKQFKRQMNQLSSREAETLIGQIIHKKEGN